MFQTNSLEFFSVITMTTSFSPNPTQEKVVCLFCPKSDLTLRGLKCHIGHMHKNEKTENPLINQNELFSTLTKLKKHSKMLRRILKGARLSATTALHSILMKCIQSNTLEDWKRLLLFSFKAFITPTQDLKNSPVSLTTKVKNNIASDWNTFTINRNFKDSKSKATVGDALFAKRAITKLEDGDISGAVRVLSSEEAFAPNNDATLLSLKKNILLFVRTFLAPISKQILNLCKLTSCNLLKLLTLFRLVQLEV